MPAPMPTLGYPSRTAAAKALAADGLTEAQIAERIGISTKAVFGLLDDSKRAKRPAETNGRTVVFPLDTLDRLKPHADRRGISVNELCRRLVETAADESMVDGILDDLEGE